MGGEPEENSANNIQTTSPGGAKKSQTLPSQEPSKAADHQPETTTAQTAPTTTTTTTAPTTAPTTANSSTTVATAVSAATTSGTTAPTSNPVVKADNVEAAKPLGPPPRPGQNPSTNTPDFFGAQQSSGSGLGGSLSLEPNPFEQSFGNPATEGPSVPGNKLPSFAALTSPQSLIPGNTGSPLNWGGGSLRTGPLSPAMLSGPAGGDYFTESHHLRGSFPTPNESGLRTGLTPGGGGSMFPPAPSPGNGQSLYMGNQTPSTLEFQKTALNAAASKRGEQKGKPQATQPPATQSITSQPPAVTAGPAPVKTEAKPAGQFDNHDNDAANGLYMLAQGRNGSQPSQQFPMAAPQAPVSGAPAPTGVTTSSSPVAGVPVVPGSSARVEPINGAPTEGEQPKPTSARGGKRKASAGAATNGRGKGVDGTPSKNPSKKVKTATSAIAAATALVSPKQEDLDMMMDDDDEDDAMKNEDMPGKHKMTDEEKRKNFLERNRVAALKCRQRKKQWLANLQNKVELYTQENDQLTSQVAGLRDEIVNLKTLLLAHKDCPVSQQQGLGQAFMQSAANLDPGFNAVNPQMNPYGMTQGSMPNSQVMTTQQVDRRFA